MAEPDPAARLDVPSEQHPPSSRRAPGTARGVSDSQLAVLLRQTQWALDDAAYDCAGAGLAPRQREELAGTLESLAAIVRASAPDGAR